MNHDGEEEGRAYPCVMIAFSAKLSLPSVSNGGFGKVGITLCRGVE